MVACNYYNELKTIWLQSVWQAKGIAETRYRIRGWHNERGAWAPAAPATKPLHIAAGMGAISRRQETDPNTM